MSDFECIDQNDVEDVAVVKFKDEKVVDPSRIEAMGTELLSLASGDEPRKLLINFENVRFFSSAAINKLIVLEKRVRAQGGLIKLCNLRPEVGDLFNFTNLDNLFPIFDSQDKAIEAFGNE